jgi:hypothetical protein
LPRRAGGPKLLNLTPRRLSPRTALRTWFAEQFTGDFHAMLDRRLIRFVVPYSPTLFFEDKGTNFGTTANGAQLFEQWINRPSRLVHGR